MSIKICFPRLVIVILASFSLASCSNSLVKQYANQNPKIDIKTYFNGDIESWGFVEDNDGKVTRRFTAKINGKWSGNKGIIQEEFVFNNGEKDGRTWMLTVDDANNFTAIAHDIIGVAKGTGYGNTISVNYLLTILEGKRKSNVNTKDMIYLIDDKSAISIAKMSRFGFEKGKIITSYRKVSPGKSSLEMEQITSSAVKNPANAKSLSNVQESISPVSSPVSNVTEENKTKFDK